MPPPALRSPRRPGRPQGVSLRAVDPAEHTLEAYRLDAGAWLEIGRFSETDRVAVPPFEAAPIDLEGLWLPARLSELSKKAVS